ncbi:LysE/ArgO family amino acid transporter [Ornithinimicrobium kibberense]|uniref:LysE/ArgO family amino acid transporter n=1 Tax=Ornithinimicrobium kibberense TaxID=282060 RepID=UPI0011415B7E
MPRPCRSHARGVPTRTAYPVPVPLSLAVAGLLTGWALIAAVGAQNAYLLRQGIVRRHVGPLVALCALSDVVLILAAVLGIGALVEAWPPFLQVARWGGGAFLVAYGLLAARRALREEESLRAATTADRGLGPALATMAALTWLNPHLYLDMVVLGAIANSHGPGDRWWYYAGLVVASVTWFTALGYGSGRLQPLFARPRAWQVLDALIAVVMVSLGVGLVLGG